MRRGSPVPQSRLAILAYGSLLHSPGAMLAPRIVGVEPCVTPFPVEYGRASRRWGGGPVLVPHARGGVVNGALLLLADDVDLGDAVEMLAGREGLEDARGVVQVDMPGGRLVLAASLPRNLPAPDMTPDALARRAVESARLGPRNGVVYLAAALRAGISTPLSAAYAARIVERVGAASLTDAERLVALDRPARNGGADGLG
jgi:hypothetical protein